MKHNFCNLHRSAKLQNKGLAIKPEIGDTKYIIPSKNSEKPSWMAIVGRNVTRGPVANENYKIIIICSNVNELLCNITYQHWRKNNVILWQLILF